MNIHQKLKTPPKKCLKNKVDYARSSKSVRRSPATRLNSRRLRLMRLRQAGQSGDQCGLLLLGCVLD